MFGLKKFHGNNRSVLYVISSRGKKHKGSWKTVRYRALSTRLIHVHVLFDLIKQVSFRTYHPLNRFFFQQILAVAILYKYNDVSSMFCHTYYLIWHYFSRFRKVLSFVLQAVDKNNNNNNKNNNSTRNSVQITFSINANVFIKPNTLSLLKPPHNRPTWNSATNSAPSWGFLAAIVVLPQNHLCNVH